MLLRMILLQALLVGVYRLWTRRGSGFGVGILLTGHTQIAFRLPWQLLLVSALAILSICLASAAVSIRKVMHLEPAEVFRG